MRRWLFWLLPVGLMVFGCATPRTIEVLRTVEVKVPVAVACAAQVPAPKEYPDTGAQLRAAQNIEARVNRVVAGRLLRDQRISELEAALAGCAVGLDLPLE